MSIVDGIKQSAAALGISPLDLATAISYETAGTFDPTKRGPTTQWGQHRGLIQFGEPQARQYGVDWNDPVGSQLGAQGAVVKYLQGAGVKPGMGLLDVYSAINAGSVGRYGASDANNGGAPGTVRDKVEQQMGGHRQKAMALLGGDYQPDMSQTTPVGGNQMQGILGMVAPQQQEDTRTFTQKLADGARDGSLWDALAMGFNTMRGAEADAGLAASVQGRMDDRADGKRRNQTAEWLRQNGHDDLAAALDQGVVDGSSAMSMIMQRQQQQQEQNATVEWLAANGRSDLVEAVRAGVLPVDQAFAQATAKADPWASVKEVNGQLVAMGEGGPQVVGDYRTPDTQDPTADMQNYTFYANQEMQANRPPLSYNEWKLQNAKAGATNVSVGGEGAPGLGKLSTDFGYVMDPATGQPVIDPATGLPKAAAIPGSPAAQAQAQEAQQAAMRTEQASRSGNVVQQDIARAKEQIRKGGILPVTGFGAERAASIGGTAAHDLQQTLLTVQSNVGFDRLQQMREASPTGGALGAVSDRELATLQAVMGSLAQSQSQDQLLQNLDRLDQIYTQIMEKASAYPNASQFGFGGTVQPQTAQQPTRRRFNPQTGGFE